MSPQGFNQVFNVLNLVSSDIDGLTSVYIYGGSPETVFAWHVEDFHLSSAADADKVRYIAPGGIHPQLRTE